jgi:hypothetical protein
MTAVRLDSSLRSFRTASAVHNMTQKGLPRAAHVVSLAWSRATEILVHVAR